MDDLFSGTKAVDQKLKFDEQGLHNGFQKIFLNLAPLRKLSNLKVANPIPLTKLQLLIKSLFSEESHPENYYLLPMR